MAPVQHNRSADSLGSSDLRISAPGFMANEIDVLLAARQTSQTLLGCLCGLDNANTAMEFP